MEEDRQYPLSRFSVHRPVTVIMALIGLLVVGFVAYTRIPLALFPEGFDFPRLFVWAPYPNASPIEVEEKIIHRIEEAVAQVSRVKKISSRSHQGGGWVSVEFLQGTDLQLAFAEMKDRLERIMPEMPEEVEQLDKQAREAEEAAERLRRRAAKARAKAESASEEADSLTGHDEREEEKKEENKKDNTEGQQP